jgi:hypothetical protein
MGNTTNIDYDALAKQYGATSSAPPGAVDYDALAKQYGATSSQPQQRQQQAPAAPTQTTDWHKLIPMVGQEFQQQFQPMAEELHKLNQAAAQGRFIQQVKQDSPPTHSATDTLINAYGSLLPVALKRAPDGSIDWPATMAASTGKAAALIGPVFLHMSPEDRAQLPSAVKSAIPDVLGDMRDTLKPMVAKGAEFLSTVVDPDLTGLISPRLAHAQRYLGRIAQVLGEGEAPPAAAAPTAPSVPPQPPGGAEAGATYRTAQVRQAVAVRAAQQAAQEARAAQPAPAPVPYTPAEAAAPPAEAAPTQPESTLTQQLRASLEQEPEAAATPPRSATAVAQKRPLPPAPEEHAPWGGQFEPNRPPTAPEIQDMRQSVDDLVDQKIPFDDFPALNQKTKAQVGHALSQGDPTRAQQLFHDAVRGTAPDIVLTPEEAQNVQETDQWARTHAAQGRNQYVGKKMLAQQNKVDTQPEVAVGYRDAVAQFLQQNAPPPPAKPATRGMATAVSRRKPRP